VLLAKLAHLLLLVTSDSEIGARFRRTKQNEASFTIYGEIDQRVGLVDFPSILKPSCTGQAVTLVAERGQNNPRFKGCIPDVLFTLYLDEALFLAGQQHFDPIHFCLSLHSLPR